jgi:hypothetical protein
MALRRQYRTYAAPTSKTTEGQQVTTQANRQRAAKAIGERMVALGLTRQALAERAGVDVRRVRDLLDCAGRNYRPLTLAKLSSALDWPAGAIGALLSGQPPPSDVTVAPTTSAPSLDEVMRRLDEVETVLRWIVRQQGREG